MVSQLPNPAQTPITYPESDGKPLADNTKQLRWIFTLYHNLDWLFASDPNVFVAGDLLWYPVEGNNRICNAPDVMVAFGRPKGDRGSYQQWQENNIPPQVVFEILSPSNTRTEMERKLLFYDRYGVEEYYLYDPDTNQLSGWLRPSQSSTEPASEGLDVIEDMQGWTSPRLKVRFELADATLKLYRPNGEAFATYGEVSQRLEQAEQQLAQERQRLEQAEQQLAQERQQLAQERQRAERLAERLRQAGIDPEAL